jgi:hypothetical protein
MGGSFWATKTIRLSASDASEIMNKWMQISRTQSAGVPPAPPFVSAGSWFLNPSSAPNRNGSASRRQFRIIRHSEIWPICRHWDTAAFEMAEKGSFTV